MSKTVNLTVAQALVKFLGAQYSESDGVEQKLFAGCFGIFGHGNVAGIGQALLQAELSDPEALPYILGRNEQAMVHTAVAYARMKNRLQTYAVSTSVGPGATNLLTGAALATITGALAERSQAAACRNNSASGRGRAIVHTRLRNSASG